MARPRSKPSPEPKGESSPRHEDDAVLKVSRLPRGPWIYRKMIQFPKENVPNGSYIGLRDPAGHLVARGILNRKSIIAFRVLGGRNAPKQLSKLLDQRLLAATNLRRDILGIPAQTDSWRIVHGEADGLSGLVIDKLGATAVVSLGSFGYVGGAEALERRLLGMEGIKRVLFQADEGTQKKEGFHLPPAPADWVEEVNENGLIFRVRPGGRHKTGFFLDQRDNRRLIGRLARGRRVLDLCTNTGGFALSAAKGKAKEVTAVDLDEEVLQQARGNAKGNRLKVRFEHADLFDTLRGIARESERPDLIILDPARLSQGRDGLEKALRQYRDMNRLAMAAVAENGLLLTCSCTSVVSEPMFLDILREAAYDVGRPARVIEVRGASPDHPFALDFPEGRYLKAVLLQVP